MSDHVHPVRTPELVARLNELERVVPIYRQALEEIAGQRAPDPHRRAHQALRDANHPA